MDDNEKRRVQAAALIVAEHEHKNDTAIQEIRNRIAQMKESVDKEQLFLQTLQRDLQAEQANLRKALMPLIGADLRD